MKDKGNIFLGVVATVLIGIAGWALANTIQLKIDMAIVQTQVVNLTELLKTHVEGKPTMAAIIGGE